MATVNKDFKVKNGLIVEGTTATVNNYDILTKKTDDQNYIIGLIGGSSDSANTPNTVVKRDGSGDFAAGVITADLIGDVTGNADTATKLETSRTITLGGDLSGSVSFDGSANVTLTATVDASFATDAEVATAKSEAISTASSDATTKANAAQAAAELTASNALSAAVTTLEGQITDAEADANTYTDNAITALNLAGTYDALGAAAQALSDAEDYTDAAVANLVDGAPALLDTLNELAAAIADNPNYATDVANLVAGKQDALTAGSNIAIVNDVISVTGLTSSEISDFNTAALAATAAAYDMYGAAASAQEAAEDYADGLAINYDAAGSAATAQSNAETFATNAINALDTDDIEEGASNLYYTDDRAKAAIAAALNAQPYVMAPDNHVNVEVVYSTVDGEIRLIAENGVTDSTTDDLDEGTSNLYFNNWRAIDAINGNLIQPQKVDINIYRREEATQQYVSNASTVDVHTFEYPYESVKYLVRVVGWDGGVKHSQITEILMTIDGNSNIAITEYGNVHTSTNPLATFSAAMVDAGGFAVPTLTATTAVNGCEIIAAATMLSWAD